MNNCVYTYSIFSLSPLFKMKTSFRVVSDTGGIIISAIASGRDVGSSLTNGAHVSSKSLIVNEL